MPPSLTAAGRVATLTLDEPETRNAITGAEALNAIVSALESDPADIGVLLITGAGPAFSAGGNIKDMAARQGLFAGSPEEIMEGYRSSIQRLTRALLETDLATIAAVNGPAIGAGLTWRWAAISGWAPLPPGSRTPSSTSGSFPATGAPGSCRESWAGSGRPSLPLPLGAWGRRKRGKWESSSR